MILVYVCSLLETDPPFTISDQETTIYYRYTHYTIITHTCSQLIHYNLPVYSSSEKHYAWLYLQGFTQGFFISSTSCTALPTCEYYCKKQETHSVLCFHQNMCLSKPFSPRISSSLTHLCIKAPGGLPPPCL
jgi:hypothetical protein